MGYSAGARDLCSLLAVAGKLRALARETTLTGDRDLYLTAAAALEARADRLAAALLEDRHDRDSARPHRPVDLLV